ARHGMRKELNIEQTVRAMRLSMEVIAGDPSRERLLETASRVARMYNELCYGIARDPSQEISCLFSEQTDELVLVRDISFASICEHHLVPFIGVAHVGYIPNEGRITGLSKLARVVELTSTR